MHNFFHFKYNNKNAILRNFLQQSFEKHMVEWEEETEKFQSCIKILNYDPFPRFVVLFLVRWALERNFDC